MAVDTAAKRVSVLNLVSPDMPPLPTGLVTLEDRYSLLGTYIGLVAEEPIRLLRAAFMRSLNPGLSQGQHIQTET